MCWIWLGVHSYQENLGAYLGYRYICYSGAIWGPSGIFSSYFWVIRTFGAIGAIGGHQGYHGCVGLFGDFQGYLDAIGATLGLLWLCGGLAGSFRAYFRGWKGWYHTYSLGLTLACNYSVWTKPMLLLKCRIPDFLVRSPEFWLHYWTTALLV